MTLRTLNYGNYGIFLKMGNAGFCPSAVWSLWVVADCGDLGSDGSLALNHETLHDADGKAAQEKDHPKPYQPQPYPEPYLNLPNLLFVLSR